MKKILLFLLFLLFLQYSQAQIFSDELCGEDNSVSLADLFSVRYRDNNKLLQLLDSLQKNEKSKILYRIPVKFWVYRASSGQGVPDEQTLKELMVDLNYYHQINQTGISFYLKPKITYINSDRHQNFGYYVEAPIQLFTHGEKGCINVFIVRNLAVYRFGKAVRSFNGTQNWLSGDVIVRENSPATTMSHEIGHYLGLKHPHRNWKRGKRKQESVSRSRKVHGIFRKGLNCENNGDKLCDTPAEPDLSGNCDKDCKFTGTMHDRWGDLYHPNTDNIMSYTTIRECRDKFTAGQKAVMLNTLSKNKYQAAWSTDRDNSEFYEFDAYEPDNTQATATELLFDQSQIHTFHKIFNGYRKKDTDNDEDWFYFNINDSGKKSVSLTFSKSVQKSTPINVQIFDDSGQIRSFSISALDGKPVKIENLSKGKYYIRITKPGPDDFLSGYQIKLTKNL